MLERVLTPYRLKLSAVKQTKEGRRIKAHFDADVPPDVWSAFVEGTTGKIISRDHVEGNGVWGEIIKGRILSSKGNSVSGELYFDSARYSRALERVKEGDYLEIDPFGVTSKIESALCEAAFFRSATDQGFVVTRMPENVAKHVGTQNYYDFRLEKGGRIYRVELKSLWGTDTTKARLIHTVSKEGSGSGKNRAREDKQVWSTSSCRFADQDIFAVGLWLRTGRITDFAYALSESSDSCKEWGLPKATKHPSHVTQNPPISDPPTGVWTQDLTEACQRVDAWKAEKKA
jgi:hypothetical protein